jgi:hypothetical protein
MVLAMTGHASAQSGDSNVRASAEQLFDEARALVKEHRWAEACPKFEASLRADAAAGTRLNLANCYEHTGKLASAWGLYREAIETATSSGDIERRDFAQQRAAALEPRLPRLAVSVSRKPPVGFVVTRDGTKIDAGALGVALYVDPGSHDITASAPGFESATQTVTLVESKTETLVLAELKPLPASSVLATEEHATPGPAGARSRRAYLALGGSAAGVVTLGVGLLYGAKARSAFSDVRVLCPDLHCSSENGGRAERLVSDARSNATRSTVLVIGGSAVLVTSAIVLLTAPRLQERSSGRIVPVAHAHGAGLAVVGRF